MGRRPTSLEREQGEQPIGESAGEPGAKYIIDNALVLYFPAPHSFTGEDVVEYHIHGSRAVIRKMLAIFAAQPALRLAEPGEFSRRAFHNGKMDLTVAEGLADLIDAETEAQRRQALRIMGGDAARFYEKLRSGILHALAYLEAYIDFPDEDIPPQVLAEIDEETQAIAGLIGTQLTGAPVSEKIREGIGVAILGPPNAGKSSLMNRLAGRDVAIVSHIAGTTRDVIEVELDIQGYPVIMADTAGLREHAGEIEREGIRRSLERAANADIKILLLDASDAAPLPEDMRPLMDGNTLIVLNKSDLALPSALPFAGSQPPIPISVKEGLGMDVFMAALAAKITSVYAPEDSYITRSRHRLHLMQALDHIMQYGNSKEAGLELRCEELRRAATEIGKITGAIAVDELLGHIFSSFCIGK